MAETQQPVSRSKDAIIAAIATVLAAVIGAAAIIISSSHRDRDTLKQELERTREEAAHQTVVQKAALSSAQSDTKKAKDELARRGITDTAATAGKDDGIPDEEGFSVVFERCKRSGQAVDCAFQVTNHQPQRRLHLVANGSSGANNSRALDEQGQQLNADNATLGGLSGTNVRFEMPSNVPVPAVVRFRDVPLAVSRFTVLDVSFVAHHDFRIQKRDVVLE